MNREMAIEESINNYIKHNNYIGSRDDLKIDAKWNPRFFKDCYWKIHIDGAINGKIVSEEYNIIASEAIFKSRNFIIFTGVYSLLVLSFIIGYIRDNHFLELTYFSPIFLGFFYFKMTYKRLGSLLKKQADTISFFLSTLTACYLQIKVMGLSLTFFPVFGKPFSDFLVCITLHMLCMFITVKFLISALDLLESYQEKGSFLQWLEKHLN
ncbi:hypothetical protein [Pantoea ananatis]|uniref:hypothetical protein n=1 Tax=Pantoea ananas TaxID=553 RepID=UPI0013754365|nr:hypothetical protein [Pantoea ananatis]NCU09735.1 hypothetical protein [Pantoea ananatis]